MNGTVKMSIKNETFHAGDSLTATTVPFDYTYYQAALLRKNQTLVSGIRKIFNITTTEKSFSGE